MTEVDGWGVGIGREAGIARGREKAEAMIGKIMAEPAPPVAEAEGPAPFTPQWNAEQLAGRVLAGEAEAERARRRRAQDEGGVKAEVTSAPGRAPGAAERRAWALKAVTQGTTEVIASPDVSPAAVDFAWRMPDGQVKVAKSAPPQTWVITPSNSDAIDLLFERRQHDADDLRLIAAYGAEQCVREGIVDAADAARLVKSKPPPGPRHYPDDISRTVA